MALAWSSFAAALGLSVALAPLVARDAALYAASVGFGTVCLSATVGLYAARRDRLALQANFAMLGVGSAVLAASWLAAI